MKKKMIKHLLGFGCVMLMLGVFCLATAMAGGPPLKEKTCGACHQDFQKIMPAKHPDVGKAAGCLTCHKPDPSKSEPTKFSEAVHKAHQGGKVKFDCSACHAL